MSHTLSPTALVPSEHGNAADNLSPLGDPAVYLELGSLLPDLKSPYREFFAFRWGLDGHRPHTVETTARRFRRTERSMRHDLDKCLWNVAAIAAHRPLPAVRQMLGPDRKYWVERAFQLASRWSCDVSRASEARLFLVAAGVDVPDIWPMICDYTRSAGIGGLVSPRIAPEATKHLEASQVIESVLAHTIWPAGSRAQEDVSVFKCRRPLPSWVNRNSGYFHSDRHGRLVQYESMLEREILRALDLDARVTAFQEQPVTIEYTLEDGVHTYTPDIAFRLSDGRVILVEVKPPYELGKLVNWRRWQALHDHCQQHGYGMFIGNARTSIVDHYLASLDYEHTDLVAALAKEGPIPIEDYNTLHGLICGIGIARAATAALLDWRPKRRTKPLCDSTPADRMRAEHFWSCIAQHAVSPR